MIPSHLISTNIGPTTRNSQLSSLDDSMTYFVFKSLRLKKTSMVRLMTLLLVLSLIMERYCFIITVYKTKYYGYVLILIVIFLNCLFNFMLSVLRKKKQEKRFH